MRATRNDQVFTPPYIVSKMLDDIGYKGEAILNKTIFEPSFGEGAFLFEIVNRILTYGYEHHYTQDDYVAAFNNVYGIEKDEALFNKTKENLFMCLLERGILYDWPNLICADSTTYKFDKKFDFCVGNPPFARVHSLSQEERDRIETSYRFGQGNTDLYIIFFEIGLNSLKEDGKLCYITPNSYLKNSSQKQFRKYLVDKKMVKSITDYGSYQVFDGISTYTAISLFDLSESHNKTEYVAMDSLSKRSFKTEIDLSQYNEKPWVVQNKKDTAFLNKIQKRKVALGDLCDVQYGVATNADKVYVVKDQDIVNFDKYILRPLTKASTLNSEQYIIFPYQWNEGLQRYDIISESQMQEKYPKTYSYLQKHKNALENRDMEKQGTIWYQYGRSQGIQNSNQRKIAIKHILASDSTKCEISELTANTIVYSGIYIVVKEDKNYDLVKNILLSDDFHKYLMLSGKDMSGGYKSFNTKLIKDYRINLSVKKNDE